MKPHEKGAALVAYMERVGAKKQPGKRTDKTKPETSCTLQEVAKKLGIEPSTATRHIAAAEFYAAAAPEQKAAIDAGELTPKAAEAQPSTPASARYQPPPC